MTLKRILATVLAVGLMSCGAGAADSETTGVTVKTDPPGAQVILSGEARVSGVSPVHFNQPLIGDYELKVVRPGFESHTSHLILDPTRHTAVDVPLSRKTRFKGLVRSTVIPGWGQWYGDRKGKATMFALLMVGSGVAYLVADDYFDDKYDDFEARRSEFDSLRASGTRPELEAAWVRLNEAQDEAYDAENIRRVTIGAAIGVWAVNLLDILFFFPDERGTFSIKGIDVSPGGAGEQIGITLSTGF